MLSEDLLAWLGPAAADLTEDQLDTVIRAAGDIQTRYPHPDEADLRETALTATVAFLLGDTTAEETARQLSAARTAQARAYAAALQVAVLQHQVGGVPKAIAARTVGVDRMSLLKALGERR